MEAGQWILLLFTAATLFNSLTCQETVQVARSTGRSGIQCAKNGRKCLYGHRCDKTRGACECDEGQKGNAEIECVGSDEYLCLLTGDPITRVQGFGGGVEDVQLPCTFRATRFITRTGGLRSYCSVEVHVTGEAYKETYRTRAVHVMVGVTDPIFHMQSSVETVVSGYYAVVNGSDSYSYTARTSPMDIFTYGSTSQSMIEERRQQEIIMTSLDDVNNMMVLDIPECRTRIKFRGYDSTVTSTQPLLPGVAIVVPEDVLFYDGYGTYPYSLCGTPQDPSNLYNINARNYGGNQGAMVVAALSQKSPQFDNPMTSQCQSAYELFDRSPDKASDIKACHFILTKKLLLRCLDSKDLNPIEIFNACMLQRHQKDDVMACATLQLATSACGNRWEGSKQYCDN